MYQEQDIDVLAPKVEAIKPLIGDALPSVEEMPVLPGLRKLMDVDLAVNADGRVYIFYDGVIAEDTEYVLYSIDDSSLHLVSLNGRIQDIGMTVHKPMRKYMRGADNIYVIEVKEGSVGNIINIPMVIHDIGI
jgi:hypothetical protein